MSEKSENELINQFDSNKEQTGLWKYYYSNGNLCFEGNYVDGKAIGLWKYYNREGQLNKLISYV